MTMTAEALVGMRADDLTDDETATLRKLLTVWASKRSKNLLLSAYYDGHVALKDMGISIPPQLQGVKYALGWPRKAVRAITRKHLFEGFSIDGKTDPFELDELLEANQFDLELLQGFDSTYKHSFSLLTTSVGLDGEPAVVTQVRDAEWSSGIWDKRRREVGAALTITDTDESGDPTSAVLWLRHATIRLERTLGVWRSERLTNRTGRTLVELLPCEPSIGRPFGRSRISPEVRYLTDAAVRTLARTETGAEFFTSPQRYALGAEESAFKDSTKWSAITGRVWALSANEDGAIPNVGQFPQMTMQPHLEQYRQFAQNFCAETSLPQSAVGLFADNPASAEAMQAAEAQLAEDAEFQWRVFRPALVRTHQNMIMLRDKLTEPPAESWGTVVNYTPPRYVSPQAASDFVVKAVSAIPELATTTVMLRRLGLSKGEIEEVQSEWRRAGSGSVLDKLAALQPSTPTADAPSEAEPSTGETSADLKAKFDALGIAIRAGVDPQDAAARLGLVGVKFTGAVPVSLRMPEAEADGLEEK